MAELNPPGPQPDALPGARAAGRRILHVDMDAFFVSCEIKRRPELRGLPVIVGGAGDRGVVAAASYEARRYGIHSAMPSVRARRLCPHAVVLSGDHAHYSEVSAQVHAIFESFTPLVEPIALDEAFLDVTGSERLFGDAAAIGWAIRERIATDLELSASVGLAPSKLVAKLASEAAKPVARPEGITEGKGLVEITAAELLGFLRAHPVRALWGVGPKTFDKLQRLGIATIGDLADAGEAALVRLLGPGQGRHLHRLASGIDERAVESDRELKSISHEETFSSDRHERRELQVDLVRMCDAVAARLRAQQLSTRTISVKVRFGDFRLITRAVTLPAPVDTGHEVLRAAASLLDAIDATPGIRLLGVAASQLVAEQRQLTLDDLAPGWGEATDAVDEIRRRFGTSAIGPASLTEGGRIRTKRSGEQQWGPGSDVSGSHGPPTSGR
ncbi:MAG: DNA polymerase IV [Acidimicrobiia bacterium]